MSHAGRAGGGEPIRRQARLGLGPTVLVALILTNVLFELVYVRYSGTFAMDFKAPVYDATRHLLDGRNPYPSAHHDFVTYPAVVVMPVVMLVVSPLALLPKTVATLVWVWLLAAAAVATLRVLGVRERREWFLWLTGAPVVIGVVNGNTIVLVALALAVAWRHRESPRAAAAGVTVAAVLKLWPVLFVVWLFVSGRRSAARKALAWTTLALGIGWLLVGWRAMVGYPAMLDAMSADLASRGAWLIALLVNGGVPYKLASAVGVAGACCLLAAAARARDDQGRFMLTALAGITATATSWLHYVALTAIPRRGTQWLVMPALWIAVDLGWALGFGARAAATLAIVGAGNVWLLRRVPGSRGAEGGSPASRGDVAAELPGRT